MKALEIRYSNGIMNFNHTSFEHELGEQIPTTVNKESVKMYVIAREENINEDGYKLFLKLYDNYNGSISRKVANRGEAKARLALHILTLVGKMNNEEQTLAYEEYINKLRAQRDAQFIRNMNRLEKMCAAI